MLDATLVLVGERDPIEERLALVQQLLDAAGTVDDREAQLLADSDARWLHLTAGDLAASREHGARYESIVAQLGMPRYHAGVAQRRAMAAILAGRWAEGEAYAAEMLEHRPDREFFEGYAAQISVIRMEQGRCEELIPLMSQVQTHTQPVWAAGASQVAAEMGDRDTAAATLTSLSERFSRMSRDITWLTTFAVSTRTALELGDATAAALLAAGMDEHASADRRGRHGRGLLRPRLAVPGPAGRDPGRPRARGALARPGPRPLVDLGAEAYLARVQLWRGELLAGLGGVARRARRWRCSSTAWPAPSDSGSAGATSAGASAWCPTSAEAPSASGRRSENGKGRAWSGAAGDDPADHPPARSDPLPPGPTSPAPCPPRVPPDAVDAEPVELDPMSTPAPVGPAPTATGCLRKILPDEA